MHALASRAVAGMRRPGLRPGALPLGIERSAGERRNTGTRLEAVTSSRKGSVLCVPWGLALGLFGVYDAGLFVWGGYGISTFVGVVGVRMGLVLRARRR
jgi:hypothetical protein